MRPLTVLVPALAVALLTACGATDDGSSPGAEPSPATSSGAAPTSPSPTPDPGEVEGGPGAGADLPPDLSAYERIAILFDGTDDDALALAREQWRAVKAGGHDATYWQQDERGRWQRKA